MIFTFEIQDEAVELLKKIKLAGTIEFRDYEYKNIGEFQNSSSYMTPLGPDKFRDEAWYFRRNFCEPEKLNSLFEFGLIDDVEDAWNPTFEITARGEEILRQAKL